MRKTRNAMLNLISLESKITPAVTAKLSGGNLNIFGDTSSNTIYVSHHGATTDVYAVPGYVVDAGANLATYEIPANLVGTYVLGPTGSINVHTGNANDYAVLTLDDGSTLGGNFTANMAKGNDDIQIQTRTNGFATINGRVDLFGGDGADNFFCFDTIVNGRSNVNGGTSGFRTQFDPALVGSINYPTGFYPAYGDVFQFSDMMYSGDVAVTNCMTLMDNGYGTSTIGANLRITNSTASPLGNYRTLSGLTYAAGAVPGDPGTYSGLVVIDAGNIVNGDFFYVGSKSNDGIYINGTIKGRMSVTAGAGDNNLYLGDRGGVAAIGKDFSYVGGAGIDRLTVADGSSVGGKATFNTGDALNIYDLNHAFTVAGDVRVTAGKNDDVVGKLGGTIGGNVFFNLGAGNNSVEFKFTGNPASTNISYTGGANSDSVLLNGAYRFFNGNFGAGNDTFAYAPGASLSFAITANGGANTDTYILNGVTETWKVSKTAFEVTLP